MSNVTSLRLSLELQLLRDSTDVPFSKRVNVIAERYNHLISTCPVKSLPQEQMDVLRNIPGILTLRAAMIEHLPRLVTNTLADVYSDKETVIDTAIAVKELTLIERIALIERLEHGG